MAGGSAAGGDTGRGTAGGDGGRGGASGVGVLGGEVTGPAASVCFVTYRQSP